MAKIKDSLWCGNTALVLSALFAESSIHVGVMESGTSKYSPSGQSQGGNVCFKILWTH